MGLEKNRGRKKRVNGVYFLGSTWIFLEVNGAIAVDVTCIFLKKKIF